MKRTDTPKIKICGLTRDCDIDYVNEAEPEYIGFVFAPSKRRIAPQEALRLRQRLAKGIQAVGVFVNEESEKVVELLKEGIIDIAQLHGQEDVNYIRYVRERTDSPIIKAMHPGEARVIVKEIAKGEKTALYEAYEKAGVDYFLFDSGGGTGKTFDWQLIPKVSRPWFLAGGLKIENVEQALALQPYALDISSGVETQGCKDREKILEMIRRIRNV